MTEIDDDEDLTTSTRRMIAEAPICEPIEGEYIGPCHWSRTGWAIYRADGACTCRPAVSNGQ